MFISSGESETLESDFVHDQVQCESEMEMDNGQIPLYEGYTKTMICLLSPYPTF